MRDLLPLLLPLLALTGFTAWRIPAPAPVRSAASALAIERVQRAEAPAQPDRIELHAHSLRLAGAARARLGDRDRSFRNDCSGYVASVLEDVGLLTALSVPREARVADFWADAVARDAVHHDPLPAVGDLAFFDNTWDRDGNGRMDDRRTHIAVVVDVEPDGTVVLAHKGSRYALLRMNLLHPTERHGPDGIEWNSFLRRSGDRGNPLGLYKTAELWSGFASLGSLEPSDG